MLKRNLIIGLLFLTQMSMLPAQEVIDPLPAKIADPVKFLSRGYYELNNNAYFFGKTQSSDNAFAVFKFDSTTQSVSKVIELPNKFVNPVGNSTELLPAEYDFIKVGERLLLNGRRDWFDPISGSIVGAFAENAPNQDFSCYWDSWNNGPILGCYGRDPTSEEYLQQYRYYQLDKNDYLFHEVEKTAIANANPISNIVNGLFCYKDKSRSQDLCSEWPSLVTYTAPSEFAIRVVQRNHIFWLLDNQTIVMQERHSNTQKVINTQALASEKSMLVIAINPSAMLFSTRDAEGNNAQIKRLDFASQQVDNIEMRQPPEWWYDNTKLWQLAYIQSASLNDGSFVMRTRELGIIKLQPNQIKPDVLLNDLLDTAYCCSSPAIGMIELENNLFLTADTCLNVFNDRISTECFGSSPSYLVVSPEQHKKTDFTSVLSMPATPIRQLTNWQQHLFWYEYNELWRIKRLNPKNNRIDIVSTESTDVQHIEQSRLLAGTSQLWQLKNNEFYRFNTDTNSFATTGTNGAGALSSQGILVDDDFYYYTVESTEPEQFNTSFRRFNLMSGQIQNLKTFTGTRFNRLLGVNNGKFYLSFDTVNATKGGILHLSDMRIEENNAFAIRRSAQGSMGESSIDQLLNVFEYKQQLYGILKYQFIWDFVSYDYRQNLVKLDLTAQNRTRLGKDDVPVRYDERDYGRAALIGSTMLTSFGLQFDENDKQLPQAVAGSFRHAQQYMGSTFLLGEQLAKLSIKDGVIQHEPISLGYGALSDTNSSMVELGGKLYLTAHDETNGERLRQIQLANRVPVAKDDSATTDSNSSIIIAVLQNDSDPDFDTLSIVEAKAMQGQVTIQPDQRLSYQPKAGFAGIDEFQYKISDGRGGEAVAKILVTVTAVVKPPVVTPPATSTKQSGGSIQLFWSLLLLMAGYRLHLKVCAR